MINWAPTQAEEVVQNVRMILATATGSVPLARALGTPQDMVDEPENAVAALLTADVIKAVRDWEPRAKITGVRLEEDGDGRIRAVEQLEGVP